VTPATGDGPTSDEAPAPGAQGGRGGGAVDRIGSIDALRGLMALAVVLYHLHVWTHALGGAARDAVVVLGTYSVDGFFMVSGLCFFHRYALTSRRGRALWRFHVKRFFRIAPLYYVAMALTLAFDPTYRAIFSWGRLLENLSLVALYLMHPIAWHALRGLVPLLGPAASQFVCGLLASLLLAVTSHQLIERPAIRYGRRLVSRRTTPAAACDRTAARRPPPASRAGWRTGCR
jgi:peptidoglycan/LPS O-acetylase OafA/YrhL